VLKLKKNIIVEKPMCLRISDGVKIIKLSKKLKKKVFVVMQNKFNLPVLKLRADIKNFRFGNIFHASVVVRWKRDQKYYDNDSWRGKWKFDGGVVSNQASHHLDLLRTIMGEPISLIAKSSKHLAKIECEDTALIIFKFKKNRTAIMEATTAMRPKNIEGSLSIMGTKGSAKIGGFALNKFEYYNLSNKINLSKYDTNPKTVYGFGHVKFYEHVINSIKKKKKSEFESDEAIKTVKLINAIYKSIETKKEVFFNNKLDSRLLGK
jgi:predicted dehydrogenase